MNQFNPEAAARLVGSMYDTSSMSEREKEQALETLRCFVAETINQKPKTLAQLEEVFGVGGVFDTSLLAELFDVRGFAAPYVVVNRKSDGQLGSLMFQHGPPRLYFGWEADHD